MGCPIDLVCNKGAGSSLLQRPGKMADVVRAASRCLSVPLTFKTRKVRWSGQRQAQNLHGVCRWTCKASKAGWQVQPCGS